MPSNNPKVLQLLDLMELRKLIAFLSIEYKAPILNRENQKYYHSLQKAYSQHPYNLPTEEDFCRALNTLMNFGIHITQTSSALNPKKIKDLANIISSNVCLDSMQIDRVFASLVEVLQKDGYTVISGPRITGDGYYESCIIGIEGNQIEITE